MRNKRSSVPLLGIFTVLVTLMGVVLTIEPAYAETLNVSGADYAYSGDAQSAEVDLLTVTGQEGKTVYVNVKEGDKVLASHLDYTLSDEEGERDANGDVVGVVRATFGAGSLSNSGTYTIEVFADRDEKTPLYTGTTSTVFAQYEVVDGEPVQKALAVRTLSADENRAFAVPQTSTYDGMTYKLKSDEPKDVDGKQCYVYAMAEDIADSTEGHIYYYDASNASTDPIKTDTISLAKNETKQVDVPAIINTDDGTLYRTLQLSDQVTASYPGTSEFSIMCMKLSSDWGKVGSFYTATINYTDVDGNKIGGVVDRVIVNKSYRYTPPTKLYVNGSDGVEEYELAENDILNEQGILELEPGMAEGTAEYNIAYAPVSETAERTWTVVLENGTVSPSDSKRVIERIDYKGAPGTSQTHETKQSIEVDGVSYVPTAAAQESYTHEFKAGDMSVEQTIYYVPADYVAPEAYEVTVKYVNIATNDVIDTATYTASPLMRSDLEIETPESFSQGGVEWIRLTGQEQAILHSYYSSAREYVVYYRDVNDDLHSTTVIRSVRVVYEDAEGNTVSRPTVVTDNGTTTTDEGTQTETEEGTGEAIEAPEGTTEGGAAATDTGLATGENLLAVDGDNADGLVAGDGTDTATTRIEDDETPLANLSSEEAAAKVNNNGYVIGGIAAGAVAAAAIIFFVYKRRKKNDGDQSDDELSA